MPEGQPEFESVTRVWGVTAVQGLNLGDETYVLYDPEHPDHCDIDRERLRSEFGPGLNGQDRLVILTDVKARTEQKQAEELKDPGAAARRRKEQVEHWQAVADQRRDLPTQLKQLAELRDSGVLSNEEFAIQKAKLLG